MKKFFTCMLLVLGFISLVGPAVKTHAQVAPSCETTPTVTCPTQPGQDLFPVCDSTTTAAAACQKPPPQTPKSNAFYGKDGVLTKVVGLIALATGVVAVIMIIVSGFRLVTSSGDPNNIKAAKNTIIFSIAGLVVASLAGVIIQFVLNKL